jgi:hypothetical protein
VSRAGYRPKRTPAGRVRGAGRVRPGARARRRGPHRRLGLPGRGRLPVHPGRADDVIVLDNGKTVIVRPLEDPLKASPAELKPRRPRNLAAYRDEMDRAHGI